MGAFHVFKIVEMVLNHAKNHKWTSLDNKIIFWISQYSDLYLRIVETSSNTETRLNLPVPISDEEVH